MLWEFIHSLKKYLLAASVAVTKTDTVPALKELMIHDITFAGSTRKGGIEILAWP